MAEETKTAQQVVVGGLTPTYDDTLSTSDTYLIPNDGRVFLHFLKDEAVDCVVTFVTPVTHGGLAVADPTVTVAGSTGNQLVGPFPPATYNNTAGKLSFTCSNIAGLSVAVLRL